MTNNTKPTHEYTDAEDGVVVTAGYVPTGLESEEQRRRATAEPIRPVPMTRDQFEALPRWGGVAFAARCGRRVTPLYRHFSPAAKRSQLLTVVQAIEVAERSAANAHSFLADEAEAQVSRFLDYPDEALAQTYRSQIIDRYEWLWKGYGGVTGVEGVAFIAARAAIASLYARKVKVELHPLSWWLEQESDGQRAIDTVSGIAARAFSLLVTVASLGSIWNLASPSRDLVKLVALAKAEGWTDDTPVPPDVFGPMWEGKPPSWWRDDVLADLPDDAPQPTDATTV